jgi:NAD(P)-dependent dehydrogenase (short-subunit alcohol dehydrogenase family)
MSLQGKTAVVTGGGTGIGAAVAQALAKQGCRVAVAGRRREKLQQVAAASTGSQPILVHPVDIADRQSVMTLFDWAAEALGPIDILVNSAGVNIAKRTLAEISPDDWERVLQINATGVFYCLHAVLPQMRARRDGLIVNISSIAGKRATPLGGVAYNASKFALTALGTTTSLEEGQNGIRVTNIYPGEVDTPILEQRPQPVTPEHRARILQPEDVAAAVVMVAQLPPRAHIPEMVIKPTTQNYA